MTKPKKVVTAWAIYQKDGNLAHYDNAFGIYKFKTHAKEWMFSDGSDELIKVEIRPLKKKVWIADKELVVLVILAVVKVAWYAINPTGHEQGSFQTTTATKRLNRQLSLKLVCGVMNTLGV